MDRKQKLVIAEIVLLCLIVLGNLVEMLIGFYGFVAYECLCIALFFIILYLIKKEFGKGFIRYFIYFIVLLGLVLYVAVSLIEEEKLGPRIDLFLLLILAIVVVNVLFRIVLGKCEVSGTVLLSDEKLAVVELPFDLFAGITAGKYVVETDRKLKKGEKVRVRIKQALFRRIPERVI
jgi:uncharacterized membrane protein